MFTFRMQRKLQCFGKSFPDNLCFHWFVCYTQGSLKDSSLNSLHQTCILQIIPSQFKHPQVHVGDGVKGAAGQQDHGGYLWVLHGSSRGRGQPTAAATTKTTTRSMMLSMLHRLLHC